MSTPTGAIRAGFGDDAVFSTRGALAHRLVGTSWYQLTADDLR